MDQDSPLGPSIHQLHDQVVGRHPAGDPLDQDGSPAQGPDVLPPAPALDPALVRKGITSVLRVTDGWVTRKIYRTAFRLSGDEALSREFGQDVAMSTDEAELIASTGVTLCEKYQVAGQYAPEALLAIAVIGYTARTAAAFKKLEELALLKARAEAGARAPAAQAEKSP